MSSPAGRSPAPTLPELGGALGRVAGARSSPRHAVFDTIRIALATELFQAAGRCRAHLAEGDVAAGVASLGPEQWLDTWERAVTAAGEALADRIHRAFEVAASESRMPPRLLATFVPTPPERRSLTAHLGKGTGRLDQALDKLRAAAAGALDGDGARHDSLGVWMETVDLCARRIEAAWADLLEAADHEEVRWQREVEAVRAWRRPRWPLWVLSAAVVLVAIYLGLVAGGFLAPPAVLRPWAEFWWERL